MRKTRCRLRVQTKAAAGPSFNQYAGVAELAYAPVFKTGVLVRELWVQTPPPALLYIGLTGLFLRPSSLDGVPGAFAPLFGCHLCSPRGTTFQSAFLADLGQVGAELFGNLVSRHQPILYGNRSRSQVNYLLTYESRSRIIKA